MATRSSKIMEKKYSLTPCIGIPELGIPKGHVYCVFDMKVAKSMGWATKGKIPDYIKNNSFEVDGEICPLCLAYKTKEIQEIVLKL